MPTRQPLKLTYTQFSILYPNLAEFTKEKGWRCGKSFISHRSKCYTNPKTGQKLGFKYEINSKTGRKRKVRVGLNYKEYQKARSKALKKRGQGKKLTSLEQKYIADVDRLATSTRKKKQRALDAKNKRLAARGDLAKRASEADRKLTDKSRVTIPNYLSGANGNKRLSESLKAKLEEFEAKGIPAFTILETDGRKDTQTLFALNKKGEATVYRPQRSEESITYGLRAKNHYDWVESKYLHSNKQRKTLAKRTSSLFTPKAEQLDRIAYNQSFRKLKDKEFAEIKAKKEAQTKQKELEEATRKEANRKRSAYRDYLESGAKSLRGTKKEIEIPFSVYKEDQGKRVLENRKISATVYGQNGDLALHRSITPSGAKGDWILTHTKSGAKIANPFSQGEAKELSFAILDANPNLDRDAINKFAPDDLSKISTAIASVRGNAPQDFDPDNPPAIKNFNPQKKSRSKSKSKSDRVTSAKSYEVQKKARQKRRGKDHLAREQKLDSTSNSKAIDIVAKNYVDWQYNRELRTSVAELIDESKKKKIDNVGDRVVKTLKQSGLSPIEIAKDGKRRTDREFLKLSDELATEIEKNQKAMQKNSAGKSIAKSDRISKSRRAKADKLIEDIIEERTRSLGREELKKRLTETGMSQQKFQDYYKQTVINKPVSKESLSEDAESYYQRQVNSRKRDRLTTEELQGEVDILSKKGFNLSKLDVAKLDAYRLLLQENKEKKTATYSHPITHIQFSVLYPNLARFA